MGTTDLEKAQALIEYQALKIKRLQNELRRMYGAITTLNRKEMDLAEGKNSLYASSMANLQYSELLSDKEMES